MIVLPQEPDRYYRWPRLTREESRLRLHALLWEKGRGERTVSIDLDERGQPIDASRVEGPLFDAIAGWEPLEALPSSKVLGDVARAPGGEVRIVRDGYTSSVSFDDTLVWRAHATAAAPSIAEAIDGHFIAFHHNLREDDGTPDLPKWIAVRFVDREGRVLALEPFPDVDRDAAGEQQSFEFPAIAVGSDGAIAIVGRSSHGFWRQDANAAGVSRRTPLDDGAWGCRGMHIGARVIGGKLVTAWRVKAGIEVLVHDEPSGGAPRLAAAEIEPRSRFAPVTPQDRRDPAARDGRMTLFGDIQQHSAHSDGIGTADEPYLRARHIYRDDFCALTDHESFLGKRTSPGEWAYLQEVADRWNDPGEFATLIAYEWTGKMYPGPGHKVVYLPSTGSPIVSRDDVPEGRDLVDRIREHGAVTGPHHIGWTGADYEGHAPDVQRVWEICSCHGCYEHPDHPLGQRGALRDQMLDAALARGLRFGFIANSDSHGLLFHHGEARKRDPFRTGLTAVQARERTREAIFEALRERRTYATSGVPILLDLVVDGQPMGSEIEGRGRHRAVIVAHGTSPLAAVDLVTERGTVATHPADDERIELEVDVEASSFVYARVRQADGEMAWSSPVFFDPISRP
jgi:hypothetical protein